MSKSFVGETSKTAVSQYAETNKQRDVLTKEVKAGQQTVAATAPRRRDGGSREVIILSAVILCRSYTIQQSARREPPNYCFCRSEVPGMQLLAGLGPERTHFAALPVLPLG